MRYTEQEWDSSSPEWVRQYLQQQKTVLSDIYHEILNRIADYG